MKIKNKILTTAFLIVNSFSVLAEDGGVDTFSGCIGKDVTGREVKVESLSRSLENCPFAKVYLKENEENYKKIIENKIAESLKQNLDQSLENIAIQGEFFDSIGMNVMDSDPENLVRDNCKIDEMTKIGSCDGVSEKDVERRKKILFEKYNVENEVGFNQKLKLSLKEMIGYENKNSCSYADKDMSQAVIFKSGSTAYELSELKKMIDSDLDIEGVVKVNPSLSFLFGVDERVVASLKKEIRKVNSTNLEVYQVADLVRSKINSFYQKNENLQSISKSVASSCQSFNAKIKSFLCAKDLSYETKEAKLSKKMFSGFDITNSNSARNKRVSLESKEEAFLAFGKKCEIDERVQALAPVTDVDFFIGENGSFTKDLRNLSEESSGVANDAIMFSEISNCNNEVMLSSKLCKSGEFVSGEIVKKAFGCPHSSMCNTQVEKSIQYLNVCERRKQKLLAKLKEGESNTSEAKISGKDVLESDEKILQGKTDSTKKLDFFDNLLSDSATTKTSESKEVKAKSSSKDKNINDSKSALKDSATEEAQEKEQSLRMSNNSKNNDFGINKESSGASFNANSPGGSSFPISSGTINNGATTKSSTTKNNQILGAIRGQNAVGVNKDIDSVSKVEAELRERVAKLEGMKKGKEEGFQEGLENNRANAQIGSHSAKIDNLSNKKITKNNSAVKFNDGVYKPNTINDNLEKAQDVVGNDDKEGSSRSGDSRSSAQNVQAANALSKPKGIGFVDHANKKENEKANSNESIASVALSREELSLIDEVKLNALWKDKKNKLYINVLGETKETVIISLGNNKKPLIENFQTLSVKTRESFLKSKLFKDYKAVRQNELTETIKGAL